MRYNILFSILLCGIVAHTCDNDYIKYIMRNTKKDREAHIMMIIDDQARTCSVNYTQSLYQKNEINTQGAVSYDNCDVIKKIHEIVSARISKSPKSITEKNISGPYLDTDKYWKNRGALCLISMNNMNNTYTIKIESYQVDSTYIIERKAKPQLVVKLSNTDLLQILDSYKKTGMPLERLCSGKIAPIINGARSSSG